MDEFAHRQYFRHAGKTLFEPVFDGFYVVVGGRLNRFHRRRIVERKADDDLIDFIEGKVAERGHFGDFRLGRQGFEPAQLHFHPRFHQAVFGENRAQCFDGFGVTPVQRGEGGDGVNHFGFLC